MSNLKDYLVKGFANFIVDLGVYISGKLFSSEVLVSFVVTKSFTLPENFTGSEAYALTSATADTTLTVYINESTEVGTILFSSGANTGFYSSSGDVTFSIGDRLSVKNQLVSDLTLSDISLTIRGEL